jgi:quercetin dioxygenase-like cupin family protein
MDKIHKLKEHITYSEKSILSKEILKSEKANTTLFCMSKGTDISEHTSTKQGFVYVVEGKGVFNLEGKDIVMEAGVFIPMKENMVHSLKAEENISFLLVLIV